jgi:hypothetical protein
VEQAVGVEGAREPRDVEAELDAVGRADRLHAVVHRPGLLEGGAVLGGEVCITVPGTLRGRARVELEAAPDHAHLGAVLEARERGLEPPLADVAPRARDVRPDLKLHDQRG